VRSTRRTLYKIEDPFLNFWFTFIIAEKSRIDLGLSSQVVKRVERNLSSFTAAAWEELCRRAVPFLMEAESYSPASRWWGNGTDGRQMEIDIVSESGNGKTLLVGEAKWTEVTDIRRDIKNLMAKAVRLPFLKGRNITPVLFLRNKLKTLPAGLIVFGPDEVVDAFNR